MKKQEYKQIIDELINGGHDLALRIINEQTTKDSSEGGATIETNGRYPEKLAAISGFIEVLMEINKQYPNISAISKR